MPTTTSADGTTIHYAVDGDAGPGLLLLHGLGDSLPSWSRQVAAFRDTHRVVTVDVRGHGQSAKPANGDYSIDAMAADAAAALRAAGVDRAHVVGLSMGGGVAFELAIAEPGLVSSLVIVNSLPTARAGGLKGRIFIGLRKAMAMFLSPAKAAPAIAGRLFPDEHQADLRAEAIERLGATDHDAYKASLFALARFDRSDEAARLAVPTLFVCAEHDYTPTDFKRPFVDAMPNATIVEIPGAHHAVPMERPDEFNKAVTAFLADVEAATPADTDR